MSCIDQIEYRDHIIEIHYDDDPQNPLIWGSQLGTIVCFHRRYILGHPHDFSTPDEFRDFLKEEKPPICLPIYMYDHSGITISTSPFSCPWDSGLVGWVYVTRTQLLNEYGRTHLSKKLIQKATKVLQQELKEYDDYLSGQVFGYVTKALDDEIESCWGFCGFDDDRDGYMLTCAKDSINAYIRNQQTQA